MTKRICNILSLSLLLLLGGFAANAQTQERVKEKRVEQTPRAQAGGTIAQHADAQIKLQGPNTIRVAVRYSKEYGYKYEHGLFDPNPNSCDAFVLRAVLEPHPKDPILITKEAKMRDSAGFYTCDYAISELPLNQPISVIVGFDNERSTPVEAWKGGSQPQPPRSYRRVILDGARRVTLTEDKPSASLVFEMIYDLPPLKSVPH